MTPAKLIRTHGRDEEISDEELQFLADCMPEHLAAKAASLSKIFLWCLKCPT